MILISRHGNTFSPSDRAVWVGARSDLPLVEEGFAQAVRVVDYLKGSNRAPTRVIVGPLRRTREFGEVVARAFGLRVEIDDGFREIDYGEWEGLDNAEVASRFGSDVLRDWEERLTWPGPVSCWGESEALVIGRVQASLERLSGYPVPVYVCTSNGVLRLLRRLIDGAVDSRVTKVRTGALCALERSGPLQRLNISMWNYSP